MSIASQPEAVTGRRTRGWRLLLPILYLGAGAALYRILLRRTSAGALGEILLDAAPGPLLLCAALGLATTALRAARFRSVQPGRTGPRELYGVFAVVRLLRFALPFQSGDLVALALLKRRGLAASLARIAPVWMLLLLGDLAAAGLVISASLAAVALESPARWAGATLLAAGLVLAAALLGGGPGIARWLRRLSGRSAWLHGRLDQFLLGLEAIRDRRAVLRTLAWSLAVWALMVATVVSAQVALHSPLSWERNLASSVAALGLSLVPLHAPLGIGTQDAVWAGALVAAGLPADAAIPLALSIRLVLVALVIADGLLGILLLAAPRRGAA